MTDTSICNRALSKIGTRSTIANLDEDSNEAINCRILYEPTRDEILQMAHWNFAKKTAVLGLLKSAPGTPSNPAGATVWSSAYPAPPWLYEYAHPSDCLQMRFIVPQIDTAVIGTPIYSTPSTIYPFAQGPAIRWEIAADTDEAGNPLVVILTNQYQAIGVYTYRCTNTTLFNAQFTEALVCALAGKLAQPLTGDVNLRKEMFAMANAQIVLARATDANEGLTVIDQQAAWIAARFEMGSFDGPGYWTAPYSSLYPVY